MDYTKPFEVKCYMAKAEDQPLVPSTITRRAIESNDVVIEIEYAGICHSDIHATRNEWKDFWPSIYPVVPGHEIAGRIVAVGPNVTKFKVGDKAGVGCMVDSCRSCRYCRRDEEQYCSSRAVYTYGSLYHYAHNKDYEKSTYGGYSQAIVVDQNYTVRIPDNLHFAGTAPLLCAGITSFSPLNHFGLKPHHRFAVAGLGGLGHMGVKFGKAFGAHTTVLSRGMSKKDSALKDLKADAFVDMTDPEQLKSVMGSFDFILDTISADHDVNLYLNLLTVDGHMVMVGAPPKAFNLSAMGLLLGRRSLSGSGIGGIKETQDMLDFCARHDITCDVEVIKANYINEAYERTLKSDVKYRFVIDVRTF